MTGNHGPSGIPRGAGARRLLLGGLLFGALALLAAAPCKPVPLAPCTAHATPGNLQATINGAGPGSVICMDPGVFAGSIIFQGKTGVTLRGQGAAATTIAGGGVDALLVFNSQNLTFQNFKLSNGRPADAYVQNSTNIVFQGVSAEGGGIGLHFDSVSTGTVANSLVYNVDGDGVLLRRGSAVTLDHTVVFDNRGTGVSAVGGAGSVALVGSIISHNGGPGVFAGQVPCAPLPGGRLDVPGCYASNPQAFVSSIQVTMNDSTVQESGSTGVVLFPGTAATFAGNHFLNNRMTGVFAWGATLSSQGDEWSGNEEHGLELRAYPSPLQPALLTAVGRLSGADVHNSVVLGASGKLGGGVLAQGARLDVLDSHVHENRGIGLSFVNGSTGSVQNTQVFRNGGSAICLYLTGAVQIAGDWLSGNASDLPGACVETT